MLRFVLRRVLLSIPVLVVASVGVFATVRSVADPATLRAPGSTAEDVQRVRAELELDGSGVEQYLTWVGGLVEGDLGTSLQTGRPVWDDLGPALWASAQLGAAALVLAVGGGVAVGASAALVRGSWADRLVTGASVAALSVPVFVLGFVLQLVLVLWWRDWFGWSPFFTSRMSTVGESGLVDRLRHLALPATAAAAQGMAVYARHVRAGTVEALRSGYVRAAFARGASPRRVVLRHTLRNALGPVVSLAAVDAGVLVGGLVVTERVFQWPGMGTYFLQALAAGDATRLLPWVMVVVAGVVLANLVGEVLLARLDPRVRVE